MASLVLVWLHLSLKVHFNITIYLRVSNIVVYLDA